MTIPEVKLRQGKGPPYASCPVVIVDGFRIPRVTRVQTDAGVDEIAAVTVTFLAKIQYEEGT